MKTKDILSIDSKAFLLLFHLIATFVVTVLLYADALGKILVSEMVVDLSSAETYFLLVFYIFLAIALVVLTESFLMRIDTIKAILRQGVYEYMEIVRFERGPNSKEESDYYICVLKNNNDQNVEIKLRSSRKNRSRFEEYCKPGNTVPVSFLSGKRDDAILPGLYQNM